MPAVLLSRMSRKQKYYSCLYLPDFMKDCISPQWKSYQLKTNVKNNTIGWLNEKWRVALPRGKYEDTEYIRQNIDMVRKVITRLPCTGTSRDKNQNQKQYHEMRVYCLINQKWDVLPIFRDDECSPELKNLVQVDGVHPFQYSDTGYMLSALSMQDRMYGPECELLGWAATKFDEKSYAGDIVLRFYIRGEKQLLFNEIKWYLLDEFNRWFPETSQYDKFIYVKNRMPPDMIYYNIVYDARTVVSELQARVAELSGDDGDGDGKLTSRERKDMRDAIKFYKSKSNNASQSLVEMMETILSNY